MAIKYRPTTFEDVVEQSSIKVILQEQLKTKTIKNAYLFVGGAGTGKTTTARIFANEINNGQGNPIEMDAASNSGVDDVRNIIGEAK
ncbi:MAG: AAA family ATPase, partial [Methanosphaera sp.]|nr:AAA family ATPase [Methanosphaera sp.]